MTDPLPAFDIKIKRDSTDSGLTDLSSGWNWVSFQELSVKNQTREFVVELTNAIELITLKIHTRLDDTDVLTRWLEITSRFDKAIALCELSPWSGRLWSVDAPITLGHAIKWELYWEGWFGWTPLKDGTNVFSQHRGLAWDDPYFILRNESNGEYFFGQLAWPVNFSMQFQKQSGLSFKIGPTAENALRVITPGETVTTPPSIWVISKKISMRRFRQCMLTFVVPFCRPGTKNVPT